MCVVAPDVTQFWMLLVSPVSSNIGVTFSQSDNPRKMLGSKWYAECALHRAFNRVMHAVQLNLRLDETAWLGLGECVVLTTILTVICAESYVCLSVVKHLIVDIDKQTPHSTYFPSLVFLTVELNILFFANCPVIALASFLLTV